MSLVKGPFKFKWGANTLSNVSEISVDYTVDSSDTTTLDGNKYTVQTGMSATVTFTLLDNDIASLATVLPQYYVAVGETLSTGETVSKAGGAIDVVAASCSSTDIYHPLDIYACGPDQDTQVLRLVNARTQIDSIDVADGLRTVAIQFIGEPQGGDGVVQFLNSGESFVS